MLHRNNHGICFCFYSQSKDAKRIFRWFEGLSDVKIQKNYYFGKYQSQETESCIFLNSFIRALMWQSLGDFDFSILHTYPWYLQKVALNTLNQWKPCCWAKVNLFCFACFNNWRFFGVFFCPEKIRQKRWKMTQIQTWLFSSKFVGLVCNTGK